MRIRTGRQMNRTLVINTTMNGAIGFSKGFLTCLHLSAGFERLNSNAPTRLDETDLQADVKEPWI